ncbi:ras GTPase-activating protein-binding protein 2 isoform X1 [Odontomachus brunneus]|uniref:ras GTPase-activating protein-binding protein 2 isoform X1 n=1 Tax=Odontomachus brunneus TaxID=486640 RepID=UPI0013F1C827|nr:ras GTPase-activating protein-binding protein 2 isoform X1 [Odontomachus brunneus]XP_032680733.1 ras GTPase-activating protein-binding protein 2 isoform X1 [Odontomachus brunneus]XP_032680734.1 ras GTPase-activating protein-binding protein 2 isoform X1 [Odontomachus brunneus]
MVMEATPSPQSVGREFVRQYYTLLNQAPAHLHRFYNQHSSFVHGGLDSNRESTPAIGQKQIHQKIQQLNFRDCHAKISQVDSQLTLENGVVVQVSGELSNAGQPMRRFTQTFVLAIQAPKTYYVHNDIFRYQDLIFPDEEEADGVGGVEGGESGEREVEESGRSEPEEDEHPTQAQQLTAAPAATAPEQQTQPPLIPTQQPPLQQQPPIYYGGLPTPSPHLCVSTTIQVHQVQQVMQQVLNGSVHEEASLMNQQPPPQQQQPPPPPPAQQHQYIAEPTAQSQFVKEKEHDGNGEQQKQQSEDEQQTPTEERTEKPEAETSSPKEVEPERPVSNVAVNSNGPKTYANLVKSYPSTTGATSPQTPKLPASPPPMTNLRLDDRTPLHPANNGSTLTVAGNVTAVQQQTHRVGNPPSQQQQHPQQQRVPRGGLVQRDGERRGTRQYSDAHQLFLGNLPHNASESDLRQVFERYGRVAELRVHSKSNDRCKGPQGGNNTARVPNYGFITFEDQQVVTKVLNSLPIYYPDESGQKLNVEEKKVRPRMSLDGSGGRLNSGDGGIRSMGGQQQQQQQQQRGPGGPGGVMRGGQHGARGGRGGFSRGGDGGRGGGGMRQPGNPSNPGYQNRR